MADQPMTLERFIRSAENELAARAAAMVAEAPGALYNPLILHGPPGIGKTHLLHGIAHRALSRDAGLTALFESGERFAERVTRAAAAGTLEALHDALRGADILLLDDVEGLNGMDLTQEVLATLLRSMVERSRQVVVTSRDPFSAATAMLPALREVLAASIIIDAEPIAAAGREAFVRRLADERGIDITPDIIRFLADSPPGDIRELESIVDALAAHPAPTLVDVYRIVGTATAAPEEDEFQAFLADVTRTVSVVVETAPWRRRIVQAILRWEGDGIETGRLDQALRADTPPDVDVLIDSFARDAERLLQIRAALAGDPRAGALVDPDALADAEALLETVTRTVRPTSTFQAESDASEEADSSGGDDSESPPRYPWFMDPLRVDLRWTGVEGRMAEGLR